MKRFALAILVVTAVAATVFLALNRPGAEASPDATITVNTTLDNIYIGDGVLTLREAMMLATGDLAVGTLGLGECACVSGTVWLPPSPGYCYSSDPPGTGSADTIVFDPPVFPPASPATIHLNDALPVLDTGDDTLDGSSAGVIVDGVSHTFICFEITSDNNTIKGMEINGCWVGVYVHDGAQNNTVGGSNPGEGNVLSANGHCGVSISGSGTNGNVVKGNYIGTDASGTVAAPNGWGGVSIVDGAQDNTVGGSNPGEGNVLSGNLVYGVGIDHAGTNGNVVKGNCIGTDASGTVAVSNLGSGVRISVGPQDNTVGGTTPGEGNLIAFNGGEGVRVFGATTTGNTIRGNSIHSNGDKGIENEDGGNTELPPPTVDSVGSVFGTACPDCTIDIYSGDEDEGRLYEGSTTADGDGNWSFSGTPGGPNITATATDSDGNTSEFSEPLEPPWPTPSPSPTPSPTPTSDSDGDTVPDDVEEAFGSDPDDPDSTPEALAFDPDTCTDGVDNDGDGLTDADDEGCAVAPTRTLQWSPGWHNATWSGASTPEEAFACAAGNYAAAYRLVSGGWERYFPDRPDLSNMTDLAQYDAFLILVTEEVTCEMPVAEPPGTERTLDWGVGWQNEGWTGADGMPPEDVFDCAEDSYAAAYRLVDGGWERHFPGRPDLSNMTELEQYDAFLILVTAPVSCSMAIAP